MGAPYIYIYIYDISSLRVNGMTMQLYKYIITQTFSTNQSRKCFSSEPGTSRVLMPVKASVLLDRRQTEVIGSKPVFGMDIYHVACSVC